jgi:hypothetical protein
VSQESVITKRTIEISSFKLSKYVVEDLFEVINEGYQRCKIPDQYARVTYEYEYQIKGRERGTVETHDRDNFLSYNL